MINIVIVPAMPPMATFGVILLMYQARDTFSMRISIIPPTVPIVRSVLPKRQK